MEKVNRDKLLDCALCPNMCRCECPVVQAAGREAVAPAGKARLAHLLLEGRLSWDGELLEAVSSCTGCRGCALLCPFPELDLPEELLAARLETGEKAACPARAAPYMNNLKKFGSPYGPRTAVPVDKTMPVDVLFFAGCTAPANNPASVEATIALMERAGVSCRMLDEEFCCGYPAFVWGDEALARKLADENRGRMAASGAANLVTNCPECWHTFSTRYPAWELELPLTVVDSTSFLLELVRQGRLEPRPVDGNGPLNVTYHDPCIWARVEEKVEQPRQLLSSIPGIKLVEPERSRNLSRCCGGGQMLQLTQPALAEAMAGNRLTEMPSTADTIVTTCPFCREGLKTGGASVLELVELLAQKCLG